jgi:uncharacterized protein YlxW (UPF0749 family)
MNTGTLAVLLIFSIPIVAILMGGIQEILKLRSQQQGGGASAKELESTVNALEDRLTTLEAERDDLQQRVENLEAIVTSDVWDDHVEADLALDEGASVDVERSPETNDASDAEATARLARRIQSR